MFCTVSSYFIFNIGVCVTKIRPGLFFVIVLKADLPVKNKWLPVYAKIALPQGPLRTASVDPAALVWNEHFSL